MVAGLRCLASVAVASAAANDIMAMRSQVDHVYRECPRLGLSEGNRTYDVRNLIESIHPNRLHAHALEDLPVVGIGLSECRVDRFLQLDGLFLLVESGSKERGICAGTTFDFGHHLKDLLILNFVPLLDLPMRGDITVAARIEESAEAGV